MNSPTFYLRKHATVSTICVSLYCDDRRLRCPTRLTIDPEYWDKGWIKPFKRSNSLASTLSNLEHIKSKIDKHILHCHMNDLPVRSGDVESLITKKMVVVEKDKFFDLYDKVIEEALTGDLLTRKGKRYGKDTMKYWRLNKGLLMAYSKEMKKDLNPSELTIEIVKGFVPWMNKRENAAMNYVNTQYRQWRNILDILRVKGYHNNPVVDHPDFIPKYEIVDKIALDETDVLALYNHYLIPGSLLDVVRDRWILMYCTGLRVSDARRLTLVHLTKANITLVNQKTGKRVVIPYHWMAEEILKKYDGLPPNRHSVVINREIKEIGKAAGLTELFTYKITRKGVMLEETKPKYELLCNHTARRSIVTGMIRQGISHDIAGDMMGMSQNTWQRYNKMSAAAKAEVLAGTDLFKKKSA